MNSDSVGQNRTPKSKASTEVGSRLGNPLSELSQELNHIRNQGRKELSRTPFEKTLRPMNALMPSVLDHSPLKNIVDDELKKRTFIETIPLSRLHELQDALNDVSEEEFNELPSK